MCTVASPWPSGVSTPFWGSDLKLLLILRKTDILCSFYSRSGVVGIEHWLVNGNYRPLRILHANALVFSISPSLAGPVCILPVLNLIMRALLRSLPRPPTIAHRSTAQHVTGRTSTKTSVQWIEPAEATVTAIYGGLYMGRQHSASRPQIREERKGEGTMIFIFGRGR
ncbi:hypothetical protein FN846DRAFT_141981 [Sphaerosporella brunnea]|uniref:Uncharacterized protein n=1 Tax=Sphaerosporella brunnea TaxID=1250544 RepID=A0A5J5ERP8_9PEZI|nr:hypothetical protein FN846DRAFT_141981 [Sphaerosporella brunnea]